MSEEDKLHTKKVETYNMLTAFVDDAEIGLYASDLKTCEILFVNQKMIMDRSETDTSELLGKPCWTLVDANNTERCSFCPYEKLFDEKGEPNNTYEWELYVPWADRWLKSINKVIKWNDERLAQLVTFYDITKMKKMQEKLANLAFTDRLLEINNELMLERRVQNSSIKPSLIVFDILSLQKVNEAYGRIIGDCLLLKIRDWIAAQNIEGSELYRIGGDEFCIAVDNYGKDELKKLANELSCRFTEPWIFEHEENRPLIFCDVTIAVILSDYIQENEPLLNLIERTLKTAKEKKIVTIYDEKMDNEYKERLRLELTLRKCTRDNMEGFSVCYQPIVEPKYGRWIGLEALCRWSCKELGHVSPVVFIPESERLDLIGTIGLWVLETALRDCKSWDLDLIDGFMLHVNFSAEQFIDEYLADKVVKLLDKYSFPGEKLCAEITESTQFTFTGQSLSTINQLRANKILVALDDFGTGYANFYQLKNLPADILKIERALVSDIENESYTLYLFKALTELAHTASMRLVAEGVENKRQMDILAESGADYLQGFLFSKPLAPPVLESNLSRFQLQRTK